MVPGVVHPTGRLLVLKVEQPDASLTGASETAVSAVLTLLKEEAQALAHVGK